MLRPAAIVLPFLIAAACSPDTSPAPPNNAEGPAGTQQSAPAPDPASQQDANPASTELSSSTALTANGLGPLTIGMTLDEVEAAAGPDDSPGAVGGAEPEVCDQFHPEKAPEGVLVMIESGVLTRISLIRNARLRTNAGLTLGAPSEDVRAAYRQVEVTPHKYVEAPAIYIDAWDNVESGDDAINNPNARGIRYEVNADGVVNSIHAGGPSIRYVEGCS